MSSFDVTTTPSVGEATKRSDYVRLQKSIAATRQQSWFFGGSLLTFETSVAIDTYTDVPDSVELQIDGTDLDGLGVYLEANVVGMDSTSVTITVGLFYWNGSSWSLVSGATVAIADPGTTRTRSESSTITLPSGVKRYKVQFQRTTTDAGIAARVRLYTR